MLVRNYIIAAAMLALPVTAQAAEPQKIPEMSLRLPEAQKQVPMPVLPDAGGAKPSFPSKFPAPIATPSVSPAPAPKTMTVVGSKRVADIDEAAVAAAAASRPEINVLPEVLTTIKVSASDVNRVKCAGGDIKDVVTSDEKGLTTKKAGENLFLKWKVLKRSDGEIEYASTPTEIYVICGGNTYSMIAFPARMPAQTISLATGKIDTMKANQETIGDLPHEKKVLRLVRETFRDELPESYSVSKVGRVDRSWEEVIITHVRNIDVEGEGLRIKEYWISLKPGNTKSFKLAEKMFLHETFTLNPVAVSIDRLNVRQGDKARVVLVEQRVGDAGGSFRDMGGLDGGSIAAPPAPAPAEKSGGDKNPLSQLFNKKQGGA